MSLDIKQRQEGTTLFVTLGGNLDENSDFAVVNLGSCSVVEIDLAGVARCNSMGIMKWGRFLKALPEGRRVVLQRCSTYIVKQLSIYPALLENLKVEVASFYASYVCDGCDHEESVLLRVDEIQHDGKTHSAPKRICPCGLTLEIDGWEKQFLFLNRRTPTSA